MHEHDPLVGSYLHLDRFPRQNEALRALQKIASLVKPIMRKRAWKVGTLAEFSPDQQNLLGININRGQKICLRLRYPRDITQFMPLEQVVDTMLHELSHNVIGPHDANFHQLWNELRDEYDDLKYKGYTGEGFLSEGHRLGGARVPRHELSRQTRASAERRRTIQKGSGQRLGGTPVPRSQNIREVIAGAAARRKSITQGCGSGTADGERIANDATFNGFRTKAEEDKANDAAIAEALWQLVQEDQEGRSNNDLNWDTDGLSWSPEGGLGTPRSWPEPEVSPLRTLTPKRPPSPTSRPSSTSAAAKTNSRPSERSQASSSDRGASTLNGALGPNARLPPKLESNWSCAACTLSNPSRFLACDACGTQRPCHGTIDDFSALSDLGPAVSPTSMSPVTPLDRNRPSLVRPESAAMRTARSLAAATGQPKPPPKRLGWNCYCCGTFMENQWWTCSMCGKMKASS